MRCRLFALTAALVLAVATSLAPPASASASASAPASTPVADRTASHLGVVRGDSPTTTEAPPAAEIIPKPNSGVAPTDAGDRGGGLQTAVFFLVIGGTAFMAFLVWRQSKKARAERGF